MQVFFLVMREGWQQVGLFQCAPSHQQSLSKAFVFESEIYIGHVITGHVTPRNMSIITEGSDMPVVSDQC